MHLLLGALTMGLIFVPLTLGLFLSYRVLGILDLTVDGSFGVGVATAGALLTGGASPAAATLAGALAGVLAGSLTGAIHTRVRVHPTLAGILVTTALYTVQLFIMRGGNLPLASAPTLFTLTARLGTRSFGLPDTLTLFGSAVSGESLTTLAAMALLAGMATIGVRAFLRTQLGTAMRAAGSNPQMARSVAVDVNRMIVLGLALSNGVVALSGALFAQYQGFANIQMGIGAVVTGLAMLMIGEALLGRRPLGRWVLGMVVGAVAFQLLIAAAIRVGLAPEALKLLSASLVVLVLLIPRLLPLFRRPERLEEAESHG